MQLDKGTLDGLKNMLAITLQNAVASIGFMPDDCGNGVKEILGGDDDIAIIALGLYLEDCIKAKSYDRLVQGLEEIRKRK